MERRNVDVDSSGNSINIGDIAVMILTIILMVAMVVVIRTMSYLDVIVLNLLHGDDLFLEQKGWKNSYFSLIFGALYSTAAFHLKPLFSECIVSIVVVLWLALYRNSGYPPFTWIFCPCLLTWIIGFIFPVIYDLYIGYAAAKTAYNYAMLEEKSVLDTALILSYPCIHIAFAFEEYAVFSILLAYALTFAWMYVK